MPTQHTVSRGECISSIADDYGFFPDTVWDAPENAELKQQRRDPNILLPGDRVVIPDKRLKEVQKPTDKTHRFRKLGVPALFRLQVFAGEEPRANQQYTLAIDGQLTLQGTTDDQGMVEEGIPPGANQGKLTIGPDRFEVTIQFGMLPPIEELVGVQTRLNNLGYDCGPPDGVMNEQTRRALRRFQKRFALPVTGKADKATSRKLVDVHDQANDFPDESQASRGGR